MKKIDINEKAGEPFIAERYDCEVSEGPRPGGAGLAGNLKYLLLGIAFGIVFVKAEIISWYRIQEMFRFHSFHMFGVIGTAVAVGALSVWIIKRFRVKTMQGEDVVFQDKEFNWGMVIGSVLFGFGWALTGACPGPLFVQIGSGYPVVAAGLFSALAGTWIYGYVKDKLPH